jgi:SnoaL-like domain
MFAPPAPRVVVAHPAEAGKAIGVGSDEPTPGFDASAEPAAVYPRFLDALNSHDLAAAKACVDPARYRENCVGFTDGYVDWAGAKASVQTIWKGLPDLHVELHNLAAGPDFAIARGTVSGTRCGSPGSAGEPSDQAAGPADHMSRIPLSHRQSCAKGGTIAWPASQGPAHSRRSINQSVRSRCEIGSATRSDAASTLATRRSARPWHRDADPQMNRYGVARLPDMAPLRVKAQRGRPF